MSRLLRILALAVLAPLALLAPAAHALDHAGDQRGSLTFVQAVPGQKVTVTVDGRAVRQEVAAGQVAGPVQLAPGNHQVRFSGTGGLSVTRQVAVTTASSSDVVLHLPGALDGKAVINTYPAALEPIGPGKSRVMVAHTATVPPADITMDGTVVFKNVANGEFASADVPSGDHSVAILPTGTTADPLLGPLTVDLPAGTLTMVYAYGTPTDGSMAVVEHSARLADDGSVVPARIHTGSAGLAGNATPTTTPTTTDAEAADSAGADGLVWCLYGVAGLIALVAGTRLLSRRD